MRKPLLTDDILEKRISIQVNQIQFGHYRPNQDVSMDDNVFEPYLDEDYQGYEEGQTIRIPVKPSVVKKSSY